MLFVCLYVSKCTYMFQICYPMVQICFNPFKNVEICFILIRYVSKMSHYALTNFLKDSSCFQPVYFSEKIFMCLLSIMEYISHLEIRLHLVSHGER